MPDEAAWEFFGGVFAVLIPDNLKPVIADADAVNPQFTHGWLDYAGHAGFLTDPRGWPHRRTSRGWNGPCNMCAETGTVKHSPVSRPRSRPLRPGVVTPRAPMHGTTCARPAELFTAEEQPTLLPVPGVYDVPVFKRVKVHRDFHAEVAKALYSLPECWIGQYLDVRADTELVKFYRRGVLVKVHPRQRRWAQY
ncbi:hypothetical protein MAGR_20420 [Mycolicibacterium agri]|uniref:Transposase for insertion sequence element IS21-like C-terminal domain-containing protein n=1 Tax=Mycolicibacterium agri TaxID=36811 RepID=A0A7I9VYS6_MYCAG|nr:hypothetical protein MAGR_20420 [Mycolicibacterium agri]